MLQVLITALLSTAVEFFETLAIAYALARAGYRREAIVGTMIGQLLIVFVALVSPWPAAVLPVTALRALAAALLMATGLYWRSEEHTSELQSLMRISSAVFCLTKKKEKQQSL